MGKPITSDMVLKTVGGLALAVCGFFLSKAWDRMEKIEARMNEFDGRMIRAEERQGEASRIMVEVKEDVKEIKRLMEKSHQASDKP
jgi:hypothetical protein